MDKAMMPANKKVHHQRTQACTALHETGTCASPQQHYHSRHHTNTLPPAQAAHPIHQSAHMLLQDISPCSIHAIPHRHKTPSLCLFGQLVTSLAPATKEATGRPEPAHLLLLLLLMGLRSSLLLTSAVIATGDTRHHLLVLLCRLYCGLSCRRGWDPRCCRRHWRHGHAAASAIPWQVVAACCRQRRARGC